MPVYGTQSIPYALWEGSTGLSFDAEQPASGTAGERFALVPAKSRMLTGFSAQYTWDVAPANTTVTETQVSDTDNDADFVTVDSHTWDGTEKVYRYDPAGLTARFVRAKVITADSGNHHLTVRFLR